MSNAAKYLDIERQQELNACLLSHKDTSITHKHARTNTLIRRGRGLESWSQLVVNISPTASDRTEPHSRSVTAHAPTLLSRKNEITLLTFIFKLIAVTLKPHNALSWLHDDMYDLHVPLRDETCC